MVVFCQAILWGISEFLGGLSRWIRRGMSEGFFAEIPDTILEGISEWILGQISETFFKEILKKKPLEHVL